MCLDSLPSARNAKDADVVVEKDKLISDLDEKVKSLVSPLLSILMTVVSPLFLISCGIIK